MQEEKQNEYPNWRSQLNELKNIPGEGFADKSASWNKLQQRLAPKSRRKGGWFWLAAACILIALMMPWVITKTNRSVDKSNADNKIQPVIPAMLPEQTTIIVSNEVKETSKPFTKNENSVSSRTSQSIRTHSLQNNAEAASNENIVLKTEVVVAQSTPVKSDSLIASTQKSNTKQKLRVVHLNELETTPALNPGEMVTSPSQHTNKFKINFLRSEQSGGGNANNAGDESSLKIFINN